MLQKSCKFFSSHDKSIFKIKTRPRCDILDRRVTFLRMHLKLDCCLVTWPLTKRIKDSHYGCTQNLMIRIWAQAAKQQIKQKPFVERAFWSAIWFDFWDVVSFQLGSIIVFQNGGVRIRIVAKKRIFERFSFSM